MFLPMSFVPAVAEASIQALCPSLNTPVLNIEQLPVGPARAAILLFGGEYGDVCLALGLRSLESSEVVIFKYQADPSHFASVGSAVGAALSFAEGMGFLFEDDLIEHGGAKGRRQAAEIWESLVRATEAEVQEVELADEELALVDMVADEIRAGAGDPSEELLLEESIPDSPIPLDEGISVSEILAADDDSLPEIPNHVGASVTDILIEERDPEPEIPLEEEGISISQILAEDDDSLPDVSFEGGVSVTEVLLEESDPEPGAPFDESISVSELLVEQDASSAELPATELHREDAPELDAAEEPELGGAALPDADPIGERASQTHILTKFRGGAAASPPVVNADALPGIGRVPLATATAGRERRPNLLARLLGSF